MYAIPNEILVKIFTFIPHPEMVPLRSVCSLWKDIVHYIFFDSNNIEDYAIYCAFPLGMIDEIIHKISERVELYQYAALFGRLDIVQTVMEDERYLKMKQIGYSLLANAIKGGKDDIINWIQDSNLGISNIEIFSKKIKNYMHSIDNWMDNFNHDVATYTAYMKDVEKFTITDSNQLEELLKTNMCSVVAHLKYNQNPFYFDNAVSLFALASESVKTYLKALYRKQGVFDAKWLIDMLYNDLLLDPIYWIKEVIMCCGLKENIDYLKYLGIQKQVMHLGDLCDSKQIHDFIGKYAEILDYAIQLGIIVFEENPIQCGVYINYRLLCILNKHYDLLTLNPEFIIITDTKIAELLKSIGMFEHMEPNGTIRAKRDINICQYLLSVGINFDSIVWDGTTSYHFVKFLIDHHLLSRKLMETESRIAIESDNVDVLKLIYDLGYKYYQAITLATRNGSFETIKFLMDNYFDYYGKILSVQDYSPLYSSINIVTYDNFHISYKGISIISECTISNKIYGEWIRKTYLHNF